MLANKSQVRTVFIPGDSRELLPSQSPQATGDFVSDMNQKLIFAQQLIAE